MRHIGFAIVLAAMLAMCGCARHNDLRLGIDTYLASKPCQSTGASKHDVALYPVGVRHVQGGYLVVDCVVEGPADEAFELASIVQTELREWPDRWIHLEDHAGRHIKLKAPKHDPNTTVCYSGVRGFECTLPEGRDRVLATRSLGMWNPFWNNPQSVRVQLLTNDVQDKWANRHDLSLHVDTQPYQFEVEHITVMPNPVLPFGDPEQHASE